LRIRLPAMPRFSRDTRLLFAATALAAASFYGLHTLLKVIYILRLGYGPEYVGWFNGAGALSYMGMGVPSGALGNRFGTRKVMLAGGLLAVGGMIMLPLAEFVPPGLAGAWPFASQIVLTTGWSMFNVNIVPALGAVTTAENRSRAYAVCGALRGLGTFLGTLIGGVLPGLFVPLLGQGLELPAPYRLAMWTGALIFVTALIPILPVKVEGRATPREAGERQGAFPVWPLLLISVYIYFSHAGWATGQGFSSAYMDEDLRLPIATIGLITSAGQFLAILAPLLMPRLAARRGSGWTLMMASLGMGLTMLPMALTRHWVAAGIGRWGGVILSAIWITALQVFQMERIERQWQSLAYGAASMAMGLGFGSISLAGGYIIAAWGYNRLFLLGAILSVTAALLMGGLLKSPIACRPAPVVPRTSQNLERAQEVRAS
jgi:MFS family permease